MAMKELIKLSKNVIIKFGLHKVAIHHSIGSVPPLEPGVIGMYYFKIFASPNISTYD
jgi:molybdopterin synthase catalytic subunit